MKANRLIMLMVTPRYGISAKAPMKLTGMPTHTHRATESRRNSVSSSTIRMPPCTALLSSVFNRFLTMRARSRQ